MDEFHPKTRREQLETQIRSIQAQLGKLPPEKRAKAERALAKARAQLAELPQSQRLVSV